MVDVDQMFYFFLDCLEAVHRHLHLREADLDLLEFECLLVQLVLHLLEIVKFGTDLGATLEFRVCELNCSLAEFVYCFLDCLFVKVYQAHMLLEILKLLINPKLLHSKTIVVPQFHMSSLFLNLVDQLLILRIYKFDIFDSPDFHLFV